MNLTPENPDCPPTWTLIVQTHQRPPALLHDFFPPGNRIATTLLANWIAERLHARGLMAAAAHGCAGPLDNASLVFSVTDRARAAEEIKSILEKIAYLETAHSGYWDEEELVIRTLHPRKGDLMPLPIEKSRSEQALADSVSAALQQAIASERAQATGGDAQ